VANRRCIGNTARVNANWLSLAAGSLLALLVAGCVSSDRRETSPRSAHREDVIYGRKHGMALTLDGFRPDHDANGAGVLLLVSSGWGSSHAAIRRPLVERFTNRGYAVFAVVHSSSPRFPLPEIIADVRRAARFVRAHAAEHGVDPERLGAFGMSSGGHLALMLGTAPKTGDDGAADAVDRGSSRVDCVACFFPPTDFNNFVRPGIDALDESVLKNYRKVIGDVPADDAARDALGRSVSPIYGISADTAPTLICHGDKDPYVLLHQSERFVAAAQQAGAEARLIVKRGLSHGWPGIGDDVEACIDWFDAHLVAAPATPGND
jgi:acetyl esterase/lipase